MTSCNFRYDTLRFRFYFVRQPSHRLKWQEDRTGDRWTWKHSSYISYPQLQEEGESLIKKPGNPIGW